MKVAIYRHTSKASEQGYKFGAGSNNSPYAPNSFFLKLSNIEQQFIPGWPTIGR
jgi:hypothetical protein